jgi:hypothetical protein
VTLSFSWAFSFSSRFFFIFFVCDKALIHGAVIVYELGRCRLLSSSFCEGAGPGTPLSELVGLSSSSDSAKSWSRIRVNCQARPTIQGTLHDTSSTYLEGLGSG